jgi:hypothetical protein
LLGFLQHDVFELRRHRDLALAEGAYLRVGRLQESVRLTDDGDVVPFLDNGGRRAGAGYVVLSVVSDMSDFS